MDSWIFVDGIKIVAQWDLPKLLDWIKYHGQILNTHWFDRAQDNDNERPEELWADRKLRFGVCHIITFEYVRPWAKVAITLEPYRTASWNFTEWLVLGITEYHFSLVEALPRSQLWRSQSGPYFELTGIFKHLVLLWLDLPMGRTF